MQVTAVLFCDLLPKEVTITLLKAAMLSRPEAVGFLIDGFPRELSQAEIFESQVRPHAPPTPQHSQRL